MSMVPEEETRLRGLVAANGFFSDGRGMASVALEQMWGEVDRLRGNRDMPASAGAPGWRFYRKGVFGPVSEQEIRDYSRAMAGSERPSHAALGDAMLAVWSEIDAVRAEPGSDPGPSA